MRAYVITEEQINRLFEEMERETEAYLDTPIEETETNKEERTKHFEKWRGLRRAVRIMDLDEEYRKFLA